MFGIIAGFGLTFISNFLVDQQTWLRLIGGVFLCYLGFKTLFVKPKEQIIADHRSNLIEAYGSTFFLTLTNPATIISFSVSCQEPMGSGVGGNYLTASILVLGVFIGSALWWLLLSSGAGLFQEKFNLNWLKWVNRISGAIITGFGVFVILSGV